MLKSYLSKIPSAIGLTLLMTTFSCHQNATAQNNLHNLKENESVHLYTQYYELDYLDEWYGKVIQDDGNAKAIRLDADGKVGGGGVMVFWCQGNQLDVTLVWFDDIHQDEAEPNSYSTSTQLSAQDFQNLSAEGTLYDDEGEEVYFRLPPAVYWIAKAKFC